MIRVAGESFSKAHVNKWHLLVGCSVVASGLLFGYDQGVISGALGGIERSLHTTTFLVEVITSWVNLGALVGALVAGGLADALGRRVATLLGSCVFTLGVVIEAFAPGAWILVLGRLVLGVGVGVASVAAPLYAAEVASAHARGRLVSTYQLAITFGVFIAFLVDQMFAAHHAWRWMLGLSAVPGVLLLLGMAPLPDSPNWYVKVGQNENAVDALRKMHPDQDVRAELAAVESSLSARQASWAEVFTRQWRRPLIVGVGLAILQQLTGINAIIYYADKVFAAAGFHTAAEQTAATTWSIGAVNVLFTFLAVAYVDRLGRRPLLLGGLVGMGVSLVTVGACFVTLGHIATSSPSATNRPSDAAIVMLVALVVFIASFAFSLGPVVWTVINEIYPATVRGRGVALATAANWGAVWLVSQVFLSLTNAIGEPATFWLLAAVCAAAFAFVWKLVPETKGKSLAEIQRMWS
jgi:sugar porter (SP) family MFS transporter